MNSLGVFRQPASTAAKWTARGVNLAICYEALGATPVTWDRAWVSAGCALIRESNILDKISDVVAVLCPVEEADNAVVAAHDNGTPVEPVYQSVEKWAAAQRIFSPNKPLAIVLGMEQERWHKADYVRLTKPFDQVYCDWYPIHRGGTPADMFTLAAEFKALTGILSGLFIECSNQRLDPAAYPKQRCPTPDEFLAELNGAVSRGLTPILFPQQTAEGGFPFSYDAMPPEILSALAGWVKPASVPLTPPSPNGPLDGHLLAMDGWRYKLVTQP